MLNRSSLCCSHHCCQQRRRALELAAAGAAAEWPPQIAPAPAQPIVPAHYSTVPAFDRGPCNTGGRVAERQNSLHSAYVE
jgi:hypothetical protein